MWARPASNGRCSLDATGVIVMYTALERMWGYEYKVRVDYGHIMQFLTPYWVYTVDNRLRVATRAVEYDINLGAVYKLVLL